MAIGHCGGAASTASVSKTKASLVFFNSAVFEEGDGIVWRVVADSTGLVSWEVSDLTEETVENSSSP
jgi:hypothetical protein